MIWKFEPILSPLNINTIVVYEVPTDFDSDKNAKDQKRVQNQQNKNVEGTSVYINVFFLERLKPINNNLHTSPQHHSLGSDCDYGHSSSSPVYTSGNSALLHYPLFIIKIYSTKHLELLNGLNA